MTDSVAPREKEARRLWSCGPIFGSQRRYPAVLHAEWRRPFSPACEPALKDIAAHSAGSWHAHFAVNSTCSREHSVNTVPTPVSSRRSSAEPLFLMGLTVSGSQSRVEMAQMTSGSRFSTLAD